MRPTARLLALPAILASVLACAPAATVRGPRLARGKVPDGVTFWTVEGALSNGARAVAYEFRQTRFADVAVSFDGGSADDPPGKEGVALLAAIVAPHAAGRGGITLAERAFALGATTDENATYDSIEFTMRVLPERLADALALERDRLADPTAGLEDREVEQAREWLADAVERWDTAPAFQLQRLVVDALGGTKYARAAPTPASVRAITAEDVRAFLRAHLRADRMIVAVSGPAPSAEAVQLVAESFGATLAKAEPLVPPAALVPPARGASAAVPVVRMPSTAPRLWIAWPTSGIGHGARAAFFAGFAEVVARSEDLDEVKRVASDTVQFRTVGLVVLEVDLTDVKHAEKVRKKLVKAIARAADRLDGRVASRFGRFDAFDLERGGAGGVAAWLRATGEHDMLGGFRRAYDRDFGSFELAGLARETLAAPRAVAIAVEPTKKEEPQAPELEATPSSKEPWTVVPNLFAAAAPGASEVPRFLRAPGLDTATRHRLSNGLEVVVLPRGAFPIVEASLVLPQEEVPSMRNRARAEIALRRASAGRGCGLAKFYEHGEAVELWGDAYSEQLPYLLDRIACWTRVDLKKRGFAKGRADEARDLGRGTYWHGTLASERTLYPGAATASDPAALARGIEYDETRAWFARTFRPERATLVITGNVLPTEALWNELEASFGGWAPPPPPPSAAPAAKPPPSPPARTLTLVAVPGAKAAHVLVRLRAPSIAERDGVAFDTLRAHLEDRLERSVVPRHGTVTVRTYEGLPAAELRLDLSVDAALAAAAVRTALDELDRTAKGATPGTAVDYARWETARRLAYAHATIRGVNNALATVAAHGLPADAWEHAGAELAGVSPARVQEAAAALSIGREAVVIYGDPAKLEAPLRELGHGLEVIRAEKGKK